MNKFLIKLYFSRYMKEGKVFFLIGLLMPIFMIVLFLGISGPEESTPQLTEFAQTLGLKSASLYLFTSTFPYLLPLFTVIGASMAPALYSEDKNNGFYEFIMSSTRIEARDIFWAIILVSLFVSLIILSVYVIITVSLMLILNGGVPFFLTHILLIYTVPITVIASLIASSVAFVSEAMTKKISFVNSPAGVAPIFGIAIAMIPALFVLGKIGSAINYGTLYILIGIYVSAAFALFLLILGLTTRRMVRERFLP